MVRTYSERWAAWLQVQVSRHLHEAGECAGAGPDGKGARAEKLRAHWPGKASSVRASSVVRDRLLTAS